LEEIKNTSGVTAEGDANINADVVGIGGDIHIHYEDARNLQTGNYFKKITTVNEIEFKPLVTNQVSQTILTDRVIIISCESSIDMIDYQNSIVERIKIKSDHDVFELVENQDGQSILPHLIKEEDKGIYLLSEIDTFHIKFDLKQLLEIAVRKDFYLIITTNSPKSRWQLAGNQLDSLWVELDSENLYDSNCFRNKLREELFLIPFIQEPKRSGAFILISDKLTSEEALRVINRPIKLILFLEGYNQFEKLPSDNELNSLLEQIEGRPEEIIERWFGRLPHTKKLIAIAFALFDGVRITQFFEAITRLLQKKSVWMVSAPELAAIDLKDISFLEPFLHEDFTRNEGSIISSRPDYRRVIFQTLWKTHRRHLMDIFPNIIEMIAESYQRNTTNWELFGTPERRSTIRKSFVNAISDLGSINIDAAESILLDLAANGHFYVQNLVASSLVRWRAINKDEQFFNLLQRWQQDNTVITLVKEKLARREKTLDNYSQNSTVAIERIKCTVAITLSRAAEYDRKNALDPRLIQIYGEIASDDSEAVQFTIEKSLPKFIHNHILQLKPLLFENLMKKARYRTAISEGLMMAFNDNPQETKSLIDEWLDQCRHDQSLENQREKASYRDNILMTIIGVLIEVLNDLELRSLYPQDQLYKMIIELLQNEGRTTVRELVLDLTASLMEQNCSDALSHIQDIAKTFKKDERGSFIDKLTIIYAYQRAELVGGHARWEVFPGEFIPVWLEGNSRPLTAMESEMIEWVNSPNPVAKKIAVLFFLNISSTVEERELVFIREEKARRINERELKIKRENARGMVITAPKTSQVGLSFMLKVKIFLMLLFESKENKRVLKDMLRFLFNVKGYKTLHIRMMNQKWKKHDPNRLAGKLGNWLDRLM
jgi:ribosomal silencing factor RsfS